jgi:ethanolamine utilization protein EutA
LGIELGLGDVLAADARGRLVKGLVDILIASLHGRSSPLMLTAPITRGDVDAVTLSGGVSEYVYGRATTIYGDLGRDLGMAVLSAAAVGRLPAPLEAVEGGLRATVLGASQYTVQVSGDTLSISDEALLPIRNVPVVHVTLTDDEVVKERLEAAIRAACRRLDLEPSQQQIAVFVDWDGRPSYPNLHAFAQGLTAALRASAEAGHALVLIFSSDVGRLVGELCRKETGLPVDIISIDGVELRELDFIDIGQLVEGRRVVPVVVKSLVFNIDSENEAPRLGTMYEQECAKNGVSAAMDD